MKMNARELHDRYDAQGPIYADNGSDNHATILRALDLLARVEESEAEIVKNLRDEADLCLNETATDIADLLDDAASCIVAMASQFSALKAERDRLKECVWKLRGEILDMASRGMYTQKSAEAAEDAFALLSNATEEE